MRDLNRINLILTEIVEIWHLHPDLRLCQLLNNAANICFSGPKKEYKFWNLDNLYYLEDDQLLKGLKRLKNELKH
jgi:uncharacterized protein YihD (DUF1040 family)